MNCRDVAECIQSIESKGHKYIGCEKSQCLKSCDTRNIIAVEENKKQYRLRNKGDMIAVYQVDGQMIDAQDTVKCDNCILDTTSLVVILVELKGTDLRHAFEQIESTYARFLPVLSGYKIFGRIVTSSRTNVPNLKTDPQYIRVQKAFMRHGGNLRTAAMKIEESVSGLKG